MGLGVLNDPKSLNVPGTVGILEVADKSKFDDWEYEEPKRRGGIILNPQPTSDPNDPLNWSTATKITILLILSLMSGVTVSLGPMITTGFDQISQAFKVDVDSISFNIVGVMQLTTGGGTFFTAAAAAVWGKRPVLLIAAVGLFGTSAWGFFAGSFLSLSIMRATQGLFAAPLETLVSATVSELFFVHEKGKMLSIWNLFVMGGVKLGQFIASFIIQTLGFKFTFGICALIYSFIIPLLYFRVFETVYHAPPPMTELIFNKTSLHVYSIEIPPPRKSYAQLLSIYRGRLSQASFWKLAYKPIPLVTIPAIMYASATYAIFANGLTLIALLQESIFSAPPYNLTSSQIGLTNLPLFAVGLMGTLSAGYIADLVVQVGTRWNGGVYEPEFRLWLLVVATVLATGSFVALGLSIEMGLVLYVPVAWLGVQTVGVSFAMSAVFTYVMDSHPSHAAQAFVTMNFGKAVLGLVMSRFVNGWYEQSGPRAVFWVIAAVHLGIGSFGLVMYVFGKRLRSRVATSQFYRSL